MNWICQGERRGGKKVFFERNKPEFSLLSGSLPMVKTIPKAMVMMSVF